jgi:hypothetical protein
MYRHSRSSGEMGRLTSGNYSYRIEQAVMLEHVGRGVCSRVEFLSVGGSRGSMAGSEENPMTYTRLEASAHL